MHMPGSSKGPRGQYLQLAQWKVEVLGLIAEQGAIPVDQLVRFLRVKPTEGPKIVNQLRDTGCVEIKTLVAGDEPWLWLNSRGARQANTELAAMKPAINRLAHTRAINEARIFVEQTPQTEWISERVLKPGYPTGAKIPDGVVRISGEHHAVEVELTAKSEARLRRIIAEHSARHDAVVYFCSPKVRGLLERISEEGENPKLFVRALPNWTSSPPKPKTRAASVHPRRGEPRSDDMPILDLISEQGAIPIDQLAEFLDFKLDKAKRTVKRLHEAGLVRREKPLAGEPEWIWLSKRGARFSTTDLSAPRPKIGSLALMRATNEVRLMIEGNTQEARWISRRVLLREHGRNASVPKAVVEIGDERHAIEIRLSVGPEAKVLEQVRRRLHDYDAAVYFCAPPALAQMKRFKEEWGWRSLVVRSLPGVI